jgi:hypothetical protein
MHGVKTFRFRYNDDIAKEEEETDSEGTIPIPRVGDLLFRKGKTWEVTQALTLPGPSIPVVQVSLKIAAPRRRRAAN